MSRNTDAEHDAKLVAELYADHDYLEAYCKHTDLRVKRDPQKAVGGRWNEIGYLQFKFLCKHGLKPQDRLFDFGCGTLRGGRLFIAYLDQGKYTGIDISNCAISYARERIESTGLQQKKPQLILDKDRTTCLDAMQLGQFDYIIAQSVFTHLNPKHIENCIRQIKSTMGPNSKFYFTYSNEPLYEGQSYKDFYHNHTFFKVLAERYGFAQTDHTLDYKHPLGQRMIEYRIC